jgi:hypothetical protein
MAVRGYSWDPKALRSTTVAEIRSDLEGLGIGLDDDTIRTWLKRAAAEVLPDSGPGPAR